MSKLFKDKLRDIYHKYKDDEHPPVPIDAIKEFLVLSGFPLDIDDDPRMDDDM